LIRNKYELRQLQGVMAVIRRACNIDTGIYLVFLAEIQSAANAGKQ